VKTFAKILVANRGEIACRVLRSARALGYRTVAVYSDADRDAPHVRLADEALRLGPPSPRESYLCIERLLAACAASGAQAVHPGYGFLSENPDFAQACVDAGLVFIGPPPQAVRRMGNKAEAKRLMRAAGVPCIPGYEGADQSDAAFLAAARELELPLMVKAAAGGGGRGMRLVADFAELPAALAAARSEAAAAFGSGELILEQALAAPRHVEVQIFADAHGNAIHLGERDCSVQRRHQKLIEETPCPTVTPELRERMGEAAVAAAKAIGYSGAGTVEFLLQGGQFYFMEMNTRLQVEHTVTEMITGLDLVAWQIAVAAGAPLPLRQEEVALRGHAIEARLCAEDPAAGFAPRTGPVLLWQPPEGKGVRVDHGLRQGMEVTAHYDSLLAKIIAHGRDREEARRRLHAALEQCRLLGVPSNKRFLAECLEQEDFIAGRAATDFIERHAHLCAPRAPAPAAVAAAATAMLELRWRARLPQPTLAHWRNSGNAVSHLTLDMDGEPMSLTATAAGDGYGLEWQEQRVEVTVLERHADGLRLAVEGRQMHVPVVAAGDGTLYLEVDGDPVTVTDCSAAAPRAAADAGRSGAVTPPMNGRIVAVLVQAGERVRQGQALLVLESMKMEHTLTAPCAGVVAALLCRAGDQVAPGRPLAHIEAQAA
jgi:geranyl-CoA carboxylase alpha subunit